MTNDKKMHDRNKGILTYLFSRREKCIYALTGKPLFETKTGVPLYGIGLAVLRRIPTKTLSLEVTRAL